MKKSSGDPFKWRHFKGDLILLNVRWYIRFQLSYRNLEEMMLERGMSVDHTTIFRWIQDYAPVIDKRCRPFLKRTNDSWRVDETYIKVGGQWMYLYRAVDSRSATLDFLLNETRCTRGAKRFFRKVPGNTHVRLPHVINADKNKAYIGAVADLKTERLLPSECQRRPTRYLNNIVEQDHRCIKRQFKAAMGYGTFPTA